MLRLNRFQYLAPASIAEAQAMLAEAGHGAMLMAGGTDLLVNIKHRLATPRVVIGIRRLSELQAIQRAPDGWLSLGAGVTLHQLETDARIIAAYPALSHAAHTVSSPQVRNIGTIGGNICLDVRCNYYNQSQEWRQALGFCMKKDSPICRVAPGGDRCWAVSSADTVPVLIALRAEVSVVGPSGTRRFPLASLYQDDGLIPLRLVFGELVTGVHLPPPDGYLCRYQKFRLRQSFDFPLVGAAVAIRCGPDRKVEDARIVLTAVASYPERALSAEAALIGQRFDDTAIEAAGRAVFKLAKPMDNTAGSIFHRKRMARVLVERALRELCGTAPSSPCL